MDLIWYGYCLAGLVILGLGDYIKKLVTLHKFDKDVFLAICFILYVILFYINYVIFGDGSLTKQEIIIAAPAGVFDFMIPLGMLAALKYADSSLAFVSIRMITSFTLLAVGAWYFNDNLHILNMLGFALGVIAIYLLSGFEFGKKHKISQKGFIGIILAIAGITLGNSYFKFYVEEIDIPSFMFLKFSFTASFVFLYLTIRKRWKNFTLINIKNIIGYAGTTTILFLLQFGYVFPEIYRLGPLSISYKILSYSLAIPILLSILFHGESLTKRKKYAFALTALSLLFFFF